MHILIIPSERYLPRESPLAGIFQHDQAHALKKAGCKVGIIAPKPKSLRLLKVKSNKSIKRIDLSNDNGITIYRYQGYCWGPDKIPYITLWYQLKIGQLLFKRYITNQGIPDIIHAHNTIYAGIIALLIKKKYNIPYVITEHSSAYLGGRIQKWQNIIVKNTFKNANKRIMVSRYLGKIIQKKFGNIVCPWEYIPNILNEHFEEQILPIKKKDINFDRPFIFLNVASLVEVKNHEGLLRAFAQKYKEKNSFQLRIVGDGPLRKKLKSLAKELGMKSKVVFLGLLDRRGVLNEMQLCDVFVLSSNYETFGVVLIEALACGKPVIATDCGGPNGIINKNNGLLISKKDINALANALSIMYNYFNNYDNVFIRKDCISRFGEKAIVSRLISVYRQVLKDKI